MYRHGWAGVWMSIKSNVRSFHQLLLDMTVRDRPSHSTWNSSAVWTVWPASPGLLLSLSPQCWDFSLTPWHSQLFTWVQHIELRSSGFCGTDFIEWVFPRPLGTFWIFSTSMLLCQGKSGTMSFLQVLSVNQIPQLTWREQVSLPQVPVLQMLRQGSVSKSKCPQRWGYVCNKGDSRNRPGYYRPRVISKIWTSIATWPFLLFLLLFCFIRQVQ